METMEIVVYLAIALVVGMTLIGFVGGWNPQKTFEGFKSLFSPPAPKYQEITAEELPRVAVQAWENCGLGTTDKNQTVYIRDAVLVNKTLIFDKVKAANLCQTLQWSARGCGARDDVVFANSKGPIVLNIRCDAAQRKLIIS